ncbi:hypothetical protein GF391_00420, partial [Candidatus Uhrbacteria bacterium]|nr:hypothetical protein [Candidatus Uhrbacteria bacterium]
MRRCKLICRWALITQLLVIMFLALPKAAQAGELVYISEVAWAGSSLSTADEWIELANPADRAVDVSGWRLTGAGSGDRDIVFASDTWIPANGALLAANYDAGSNKAAADVTPDIVTSTVSLSNSKMLIRLFDADGVLLDQAGDGSAPFAGFSDETKASMVRTDAKTLGDSDSVWVTCESAENMLTSDCGTPGILEGVQRTTHNVENGEAVTSTGAVATSTEAAGVATGTEADDSAAGAGAASTSSLPAVSATGTAPEGLAATSTGVAATSTEPAADTDTGSETVATSTPPAIASDELLAPTSTVMSEPQSQLPRSAFQHETMVRFLRINEVMAAPDDGKEWVELVNLAADRTVLLDGLEIHDSVGRAIKLKGEIRPREKYKVFELGSSKFNNGGDSVYLQTEGGLVVDTLTYAGHEKGMALARDAKQTWQYTYFPTPGGTNIIREEEVKIKYELEASDSDEGIEAKPMAQAAVASSSAATQTASSTLDTQATASRTESGTHVGRQALLRLNEIMPNPAEGEEWVEIISFATGTASLEGLELHDSANKLMSLAGE